jgi:outer membrane protein, heavy metal efflux system
MSVPRQDGGAHRRPSGDRSFVSALWLTLAVFAAPTWVNADSNPPVALTEAEALRRGLSRPPVVDLLAGEVGVARGEAATAGRWLNPTASYSREETSGGSAASTEDYAWLAQSIDLVGRRALVGRAARTRVDAAMAESDANRIEIAADIRHRFYDLLLAQREAQALAAWSEHIGRLTGIVAKRERAGEVSTYDRQRVERERAGADARLASKQAAHQRACARLAAVIGTHDDAKGGCPTVTGDLMPATDPAPLDHLLEELPARPDLRALERTAAAADLDARAAGRWWLPEVTVNGGLKTVETQGDRVSGFLAGASVPLPLLNRDQGDALRAHSRAVVARSRRTIEAEKAAGEVLGLRAEAVALVAAARRFRQEAVRRSADLVRTAEVAYEEGEVEVLELLDAHRGALEAETEALELEMNARRARIDLDRVTGGTGL